MMKNRAGWLALIVLAVASLLMVFFVLPRITQDAKPISAAINAAGDAVKDAVSEPPATRAPETAKAPEPAKPAATAPAGQQAANGTPSFDVLRVEPDGSTVIAGRAEPHSTLEVTDGKSVVAKVNVGPAGDFAAILDNPLPPGDHQLILKATGKDGKALVSEETATVSVPVKGSADKLLAMVTTPGKASRLIATPEAARPTASQPAQTAGVQAPATPQPTAPQPTVPDTATELRVTAVELEGPKIFVAGTARPGSALRGQANDRQIGAARAGQDGSFVIEGAVDLAVGNHRIAVEALGPNGSVLVRVEVPFNRPAGEQVAAVAVPDADALARIDAGAFDKLRTDTVRAFNLLRGLYDAGSVPSLEQMVAARSATSIALKSLAEYRLPADAALALQGIAQTTAKDAAAALTALDALPRDVASVGAGLKQIGEMIARAVGPAIARNLQGVEIPAASAVEANAARTIQQAPLTQSERASVIIRRGDTLWQISRRVYGQGVRYTTIYLANEAQISNPDVIQPGQIFGVPDEARPDSEELHRQRMMKRRS